MRHRHGRPPLKRDEFTAGTALARDAADPLAAYADQFHQPYDAGGRKLVYLAGHSLGLQPKSAADFVEQELADWRRLGVLGHHDAQRPWIGYHERLAAPLARLVGAAENEVVAMNSLTVNLHLMMVSFFTPGPERRRVLIEKSAFPSDRYAIVSQLAFHGLNAQEDLIEVEPRAGERCLWTEDLISIIEREGPRLAARRAGAAVGLDLAHAVGNTPLRLHDWNADFAVWCSYKYLNAGPGAIGGCFVHERHASNPRLPRFAGWWGQDKASRFDMGPTFTPIAGAEGWQISNPPILSAAPLLASLDLFERAGLARLREKSLSLTGYLRQGVAALLPESVEIVTPAAPDAHGCQLSLRIARSAPEAKRCHERLTAAGVIGDWREPDILRLAPVPLYTSYSDVHAAVDRLAHALHD